MERPTTPWVVCRAPHIVFMVMGQLYVISYGTVCFLLVVKSMDGGDERDEIEPFLDSTPKKAKDRALEGSSKPLFSVCNSLRLHKLVQHGKGLNDLDQGCTGAVDCNSPAVTWASWPLFRKITRLILFLCVSHIPRPNHDFSVLIFLACSSCILIQAMQFPPAFVLVSHLYMMLALSLVFCSITKASHYSLLRPPTSHLDILILPWPPLYSGFSLPHLALASLYPPIPFLFTSEQWTFLTPMLISLTSVVLLPNKAPDLLHLYRHPDKPLWMWMCHLHSHLCNSQMTPWLHFSIPSIRWVSRLVPCARTNVSRVSLSRPWQTRSVPSRQLFRPLAMSRFKTCHFSRARHLRLSHPCMMSTAPSICSLCCLMGWIKLSVFTWLHGSMMACPRLGWRPCSGTATIFMMIRMLSMWPFTSISRIQISRPLQAA